jgi:protoheme IX farnesyltransferase
VPKPDRSASQFPARSLGRLGAYLALTKPRVMELLLVTTAPTMILAEQGTPDLWRLVGTMIGGAASSGSAAVFNMYFDRDMDAQMVRTRSRPVVTGEVSPRSALIFAWSLATFATLWFAALIDPLAAALSAAAIFWYVVVYTLILKRRTSQNIVWGGIAGCFPVLIAWVSATGAIAWPAAVLALVIFFWTPSHYWPLSVRYGEDYRRVSVPMLGAIRPPTHVATQILWYAVATALCALALLLVAPMGVVYTITATVAGSWFVWQAARYLLTTQPGAASSPRPMRVFAASNTYLSVLFLAVAVDPFMRL